MFTILPSPRLKLLRVKLEGFFTVEEVGAFAAAAQKSVADMGCGSGDWVHLCEVSELMLQSQRVTEAFGQVINHPGRRSRRLAIVAGTSPVRMQIRRLLTRDDAAILTTVREAEAWLFNMSDHRLSA